MQTVSELMSRNVQTCSPDDTIRRAAELMYQCDVGAIPVCDGDRLVGMITDRDIAVRAVAAGQAPDSTCVSDVMTKDVHTCFADQDLDEVMEEMGDAQIRRVPVLDQASHRLVGIVSLGDMATKHSAGIDHTLGEISEQSHHH